MGWLHSSFHYFTRLLHRAECISVVSDVSLYAQTKTLDQLRSLEKAWIEYFIEPESYFSCWESLYFWSCIKYCYNKWVQRLENMRKKYQNLGGFFSIWSDSKSSKISIHELLVIYNDTREIPWFWVVFFFNLSCSIFNPFGSSLKLCKA